MDDLAFSIYIWLVVRTELSKCLGIWSTQCLTCSDLFLMKWVDPGAFALARFDKLNKAGLLQRLAPVFPSGQQKSVFWISGLYYQLHVYSASSSISGSSLTLPTCCKCGSAQDWGIGNTGSVLKLLLLSSVKSPAGSSCLCSQTLCKYKVLLDSSVLWIAFSGQGESEVGLLYPYLSWACTIIWQSSTLPGWS